MSKINFQIDSYTLEGPGKIIITGRKLPPPSMRITLHQKNIRILAVKIIHKSKKGDIGYEVGRINHIKSFGETRLHTKNILYPGTYQLFIEFSGDLDEDALKK
jgi:hypothetical protein